MDELNEAELMVRRIGALVDRDAVAHALGCPKCGLGRETEAYLAFLGWTGPSFLVEAYPEFYGTSRG